ncbi:unnamed protein product, partial [Pylaiella littoralis]
VARYVLDFARAFEKVKDLPAWEKKIRREHAAMTHRLLVRRDKGVAGPEYRDAPDLEEAVDWCTQIMRGQAWNRLAIDLKHLRHSVTEQLCVVREGCSDDGVIGGEAVELRKRFKALSRQRERGRATGDDPDTDGTATRPPPPPDPNNRLLLLLPPLEYTKADEVMTLELETAKGGDRNGPKGGRKLFFDSPGQRQRVLRRQPRSRPDQRRWRRRRRSFGGGGPLRRQQQQQRVLRRQQRSRPEQQQRWRQRRQR